MTLRKSPDFSKPWLTVVKQHGPPTVELLRLAMRSDAGANNLPGSLHPVFTESLAVGNPLFISVQQKQEEVSVHGFTEVTIMWLTLRLDSASRHSLAQNSPRTPALSPFTFRAGTNSRAPGTLVKRRSINLPFLHWFAARSPED